MSDVAKWLQAKGTSAPNSRSQRSSSLAPGKRTLVEQAYASEVQRRANQDVGDDHGAIHAAASRGIATSSAPMPYRDTIQRAFGRHDISSIQGHTDATAERAAHALGAVAYASGEHVAFAGAPSLHTAAHEAAHVVQQRGGVQLSSGIGQPGDPHEQHADAVADRVVRGESAESLLDVHARAGGAAPGSVVQRQIFANDEDEKAGKPLPPGKLEDQLLNEFSDRGYEDEFLDILVSEDRHFTVEELRAYLRSLPIKDRQLDVPKRDTSKQEGDQRLPRSSPPIQDRQLDVPKRDTSKQEGDQQSPRSMLDEISDGSDESEVDDDHGESWIPRPSQPQGLPSINAHMGQGVSGDLAQYRLYSGSFSTCVPIVMFSEKTGRAGLFHLPQGALDTHKKELLQMAADVSPTEIRIYKGGWYKDLARSEEKGKLIGKDKRMKAHLDAEGEALREFFAGELPKIFSVNITNSKESFGWLTLSIDSKGGLQITQGIQRDHAYDLKDGDVPEGARRFQPPDWKYVKSVEF